MASLENPFTPGFGQVPYRLAGRDQAIRAITRAFDLEYRDPSLTSIFIGARGTGKTALLSYLGNEAKQRGWIVVDVAARDGMLEDILQRGVEASSDHLDLEAKRKITSISVGGFGGVAWENTSEPEKNWRTRMSALLGSLAEKGLGLLITVDEVDPHVDELAELVSIYQLFVREDRMIALLLAGLPGKTLALLNKNDITFLRRAKRYNLETIPDSSVMDAFADTVRSNGKRIGVDALEAAADAIGGFAFMMQAVGYRAWDSCSAEELTVASVQEGAAIARRELEDSVLESTYLELTRGDRAFVEAMLEDEKGSYVADIGKRTGKSRNSIQKTRRRLIDLGVIGERGRGVVAFELPYFREYLKKQLGE